jgi:hypothetical protein
VDERSILIAAFVCGVAIQAIILLRGDWNWLKVGITLFIALGVVAIDSDRASYNQDQHMYIGLFAFLARDKRAASISQIMSAFNVSMIP